MDTLQKQGQSKRKTIDKSALKFHIVRQMNAIGRKETLSEIDKTALLTMENLLTDCGIYGGFQHRGYLAFLHAVPNAKAIIDSTKGQYGKWHELYSALTTSGQQWYYGADPCEISYAESAIALGVANDFLAKNL